MKPKAKGPMAILYRWHKNGLEFIERPESLMGITLRLGWNVLAKDSDLLTPAPESGEQQQD